MNTTVNSSADAPSDTPVNTAGTRAARAVDRALVERHREATDDVERILAAAVDVMQRNAPEPPTVSEIVAAAGSSKKAFYRYFTGKDELLLAVMERGVGMVVSYLEHQMAKAAEPREQVSRWIEGVLAQVADPHLISMSRAVAEQMTAPTAGDAIAGIMAPMRTLLTEPVAALGSGDPQRDADAVFDLTVARMRRYVGTTTGPRPGDIAHLVQFCLQGLGLPAQGPTEQEDPLP